MENNVPPLKKRHDHSIEINQHPPTSAEGRTSDVGAIDNSGTTVATTDAVHPSAVRRLHHQLQLLGERVAANERQAERWRDVEATAERINDIALTLDTLTEQLDQVKSKIQMLEDGLGDIEADVNANRRGRQVVESVFADRVLERESAHKEAQQRDPSESVTVGEEYTLWVEEIKEEPPAPTVVGRIDGLVTFVDYEREAPDVAPDQSVEIVITDTQQRVAHAKPTAEVTGDA